MVEENASLDSGEAADLEIEPSRMPERDVKAKSTLRGVFLIGVFALILSLNWPYPLLTGYAVNLGLLAASAFAGFIVLRAPRDAEVVPRDVVMALLPWLFAAVLFANGAFDSSPEDLHQTVVIRTNYGGRGRALVVQSWRPGNSTESVSLGGRFLGRYGYFLPGQTVTVGTRAGALGMPWVTRLSR